MSLNPGQKHILKLIAKGQKSDGWTPVSSTLYSTLNKDIPAELATFEPVGDAGRARLTDAGQNLIDAMEWL